MRSAARPTATLAPHFEVSAVSRERLHPSKKQKNICAVVTQGTTKSYDWFDLYMVGSTVVRAIVLHWETDSFLGEKEIFSARW